MLTGLRESPAALHDVVRLLRTYADRRAHEFETTLGQWVVLSKLQRCQGVSQSELADSLDLARITVARLIDKLTDAGLVERRGDARDRRIHRLYLTTKAEPALEKLAVVGESLMRTAFDGIDEPTMEVLKMGLDLMKANLKAALSSGDRRSDVNHPKLGSDRWRLVPPRSPSRARTPPLNRTEGSS
jgi:DNA-binding MarR family transcriptional regulator